VITAVDRALTRPWTVDKTYKRGTDKYPNWSRIGCLEGTGYVTIGKEFYLLSWDGHLMPLKRGSNRLTRVLPTSAEVSIWRANSARRWNSKLSGSEFRLQAALPWAAIKAALTVGNQQWRARGTHMRPS